MDQHDDNGGKEQTGAQDDRTDGISDATAHPLPDREGHPGWTRSRGVEVIGKTRALFVVVCRKESVTYRLKP